MRKEIVRLGRYLMVCGLVLVVACGGGSQPTDPDPDPDPDPNGTTVPVNIVISAVARSGIAGSAMGYDVGAAISPTGMEVKYHIANGPVLRSAAPPYSSLFGCFFDVDPTCTINVDVGKTINFYAIEGQGSWAGDRSATRPVPAVLPTQHEFVGYSGPCNSAASFGDCYFTVQAGQTYTVTLSFAPMQSAEFHLHGAGLLAYDFVVRDQLHIPNRPYVHPTGNPTGSLNPSSAPLVFMHMPTGSTITATRQTSGISQFLRWTGACSGSGASCTLTVGTPAATATAVFEYYNCGQLGFSDGGTGPNPPPGCTKVSPRLRGRPLQTR
jgi:hypothetical protein